MALPVRTDQRHPPSANRAVEKLLPRNLEAEVALLGSVLIDSAILPVVAGIARLEDCYRKAHRIIYQALCDLYKAGTPPDLVTLGDALARRGKLNDIGRARSVSSLANQVPTSLNGEHYAAIGAAKRTLRGLIDGAGQIAAVASNEPNEELALAQVERLVAAARERVEQRRQGARLIAAAGALRPRNSL